MKLYDKKCVPCEGVGSVLTLVKVNELMNELDRHWELQDGHLIRGFKFSDFKSALEFVNKIGVLAEEERHHPDILLSWGRVRVELWTHAIKGLSENDFILAAKIDALEK